MEILRTALRKTIADARRVAVVGIGSRLRGDDACGLLAADSLKSCKITGRRLKIFTGATAPENITGEIKRFKPDRVILIDAADFKKKPGTVRLIKPEEAQGICFCTHQIPLQILADYLSRSIGCCVRIIGIQAKTLTFGAQLTPAVEKAAQELAKELCALFAPGK